MVVHKKWYVEVYRKSVTKHYRVAQHSDAYGEETSKEIEPIIYTCLLTMAMYPLENPWLLAIQVGWRLQ